MNNEEEDWRDWACLGIIAVAILTWLFTSYMLESRPYQTINVECYYKGVPLEQCPSKIYFIDGKAYVPKEN